MTQGHVRTMTAPMRTGHRSPRAGAVGSREAGRQRRESNLYASSGISPTAHRQRVSTAMSAINTTRRGTAQVEGRDAPRTQGKSPGMRARSPFRGRAPSRSPYPTKQELLNAHKLIPVVIHYLSPRVQSMNTQTQSSLRILAAAFLSTFPQLIIAQQ